MEARANARPLKLAVVLALLCATVATPCSWDMEPVLFFDMRPDAPVDRYVDGRLGILQPTYARSHLVIAFRHLSGKPPSAAERQGWLDLLQHRLDEYPEERIPAPEQWERLRASVRGIEYDRLKVPDQTRSLESEETYEWFDNCTDDAFTTATATLAERVKTFGAKSAEVGAWLEAQELVFGNCSDGDATVPEAPASLPELIRADRQYQMAAADFYAMRFLEARQRFLEIARDAKSPWRPTARLVAARTAIRVHTLGGFVPEPEDASAPQPDPLDLAESELRAILADRTMAAFHDSAWGLLAYTVVRRDPQQRFDEAAQALVNGSPTARRARTDLGDYTVLWEKEGIAGSDELTDWITTFQSGNVQRAVERWNATKGRQWLVAALTHVKPEDPSVEKLLRDSANLDLHSPAFASVTYHRVRLLKDDDARRAELDRALAGELPASARNQLLAQRRGLARTLREFLRDTPATLVGEGQDPTWGEDAEQVYLPPDAAVVFNFWMPGDLLAAAVKDETFHPDVRARVARAAETRAALLKQPDFELAYSLVYDVHARPYVKPFREGDDRPYWWCVSPSLGTEDPPVPTFLAGDAVRGVAELEKLQELGSGATWLLRTALARAKSHPDDPRVPEVLAAAIDGTRWACGDEDTDALAEKAFGVLKRRYGKTRWAKETRYWHRAAF